MTTEEIVQYVTKTPENMNPNILRNKLTQLLNENYFSVQLTPTSETTATSDKTVKEIYDAFQNGKPVRVYITLDVDYCFNVSSAYAREEDETKEYGVQVMGIMEPTGILSDLYAGWQAADGNSWTVMTYQLTPQAVENN